MIERKDRGKGQGMGRRRLLAGVAGVTLVGESATAQQRVLSGTVSI